MAHGNIQGRRHLGIGTPPLIIGELTGYEQTAWGEPDPTWGWTSLGGAYIGARGLWSDGSIERGAQLGIPAIGDNLITILLPGRVETHDPLELMLDMRNTGTQDPLDIALGTQDGAHVQTIIAARAIGSRVDTVRFRYTGPTMRPRLLFRSTTINTGQTLNIRRYTLRRYTP